jgi:hypothetical protein
MSNEESLLSPAPNKEEDLNNSSEKDTTPLSNENEFLSSLPEDLRAEASLQTIKDVGSLAKGYVHAQKELGGRIRKPGKDATSEEYDEFYTKISDIPGITRLPVDNDSKAEEKLSELYDRLGRPTDPKDYNIQVPEDVPLDEAFVDKFRPVAHKIGLNQRQVESLAEFQINEAREVHAQINKTLQLQRDQAVTHFKKEWGGEFDTNMELAKLTINKYAEKYPEAVDDLKFGYANSNPVFLQLLVDMGKMSKEGETMATNDNTSSVLTKEQAQAKITEIRRDVKHPYYDARHPDHDKALQEVNDLYAVAFPEQDNQKA